MFLILILLFTVVLAIELPYSALSLSRAGNGTTAGMLSMELEVERQYTKNTFHKIKNRDIKICGSLAVGKLIFKLNDNYGDIIINRTFPTLIQIKLQVSQQLVISHERS